MLRGNLTKIGRIGIVKKSGSEWSSFRKEIILEKLPDFAAIRIDSYGVCGIYINGVFLEAITGRYANRIGCFACTSLMKKGKNEIILVLGNHFYQTTGNQIFERSGAMFACVASELQLHFGDEIVSVPTDESWECVSDDCLQETSCFAEITKAEYERFWRSAALWEEQTQVQIPDAVLNITGQSYASYIHQPIAKAVAAQKIADSRGFVWEMGKPAANAEEQPYVIYDLGKLYVGYTQIRYRAQGEVCVTVSYDYSESCEDFSNGNGIVKRLAVKETLKQGENTLFILRRRAGRYIKLQFEGSGSVHIEDVEVRLSMKSWPALGWFRCEDELLNKA